MQIVLLQIYQRMMQTQNWMVFIGGQKININQFTTKHKQTAKISISHEQCSESKEIPMQKWKLKEIKSLSNYFLIPNYSTFINTLNSMAQVIHYEISSIPIKRHISLKRRQDRIEIMKTNQSKLQICFTRRWRETHTTIYLLIHNFNSPQGIIRVRVQVISQRGLILQTFSNLKPQKYEEITAKNIKYSYSKLSKLIILQPQPSVTNMDSRLIFAQILKNVSIIHVSFQSRENLQRFGQQSLPNYTQFEIDLKDTMIISYYKQQILVWHKQQIQTSQINRILKRITFLLERQAAVNRILAEYPYQSHHFNQKQFLLRLFAFYFNFITLQRMDPLPPNKINDAIMLHCATDAEQIGESQRQSLNQNDVHSFTTDRRAFTCPVCKKKTRIICLKCCKEFKTNFGLCQNACFEIFHKDRIQYSKHIVGKLVNRRDRYQDINNRQIEDSSSSDEQDVKNRERIGNKSKDVNKLYLVRSLDELKDKWKTEMQEQKKGFQQFMQLCRSNFISKKMASRLNFLRYQSEQIKSKLFQFTIKQQQFSENQLSK